jgi:hypothetical protein
MTIKNSTLKRERGNLFHKINCLAFTYIVAFQLVFQSLKHFIPTKVYSINKTQHTLYSTSSTKMLVWHWCHQLQQL